MVAIATRQSYVYIACVSGFEVEEYLKICFNLLKIGKVHSLILDFGESDRYPFINLDAIIYCQSCLSHSRRNVFFAIACITCRD